MGPDAVILSTREREDDGMFEVRAAIERNFGQKFAAPKFAEVRPVFDETRSLLASTLRWHGAPDGFVHMVSEAGSRMGAGMESHAALAAGIEGVLTFNPLNPQPTKSLMLVGPHGSGKTTAAAKIARFLSDKKHPIEPVAADFDASGQTARLAALTLKVSVTSTLSPDHLMRPCAHAEPRRQRLGIECPSRNPPDDADPQGWRALNSAMRGETVP